MVLQYSEEILFSRSAYSQERLDMARCSWRSGRRQGGKGWAHLMMNTFCSGAVARLDPIHGRIRFTVSSHQQVKAASSATRQWQQPGGISRRAALKDSWGLHTRHVPWGSKWGRTWDYRAQQDPRPMRSPPIEPSSSWLNTGGLHTPHAETVPWCSCWALRAEEGLCPKALSPTEPAALAAFCHAAGTHRVQSILGSLCRLSPPWSGGTATVPRPINGCHLCRCTEGRLSPLMSPGPSHITVHDPQEPLQEPCGHHPL